MIESQLHDYQRKAIAFIGEKQRCGMFLDMGLGKTLIALTAIRDALDSFSVSKVLVIAPLRVANSVWKQEAALWSHVKHLKVSVCTGTAVKRQAALNAPADIFVINVENVPWLVDLYQKKWPFDAVVVDESSGFKNPSTKRFKKLKKVLPYTTHMILLTGTPSPNGLLDLWSQIYLIDSGKTLGKTSTGYKQRFFDSDFMGYKFEPKKGTAKEINRLIAPFCMSMSSDDYLELPDRIDLIEHVRLPPKVLKAYRVFEKDLLSQWEDDEFEASSAAVLANKLLQFANGAIYKDDSKDWIELHTAKLDALSEIVEQNANENVLVAYNYQHDLARLSARFPNAVVLDKDPETIERWNRGEIKLLLGHPQSAGHGINLQHGGSMIVWFSLNWSLEYDLQFNKRLHRQGQTKPVRVVRIVVDGSIDERVLNVLAKKDKTQSDLLDALRA